MPLVFEKALNPGGAFARHFDADEAEQASERRRLAPFEQHYAALQTAKQGVQSDPRLQHEQFVVHGQTGALHGNALHDTTHNDLHRQLGTRDYLGGDWSHWNARDPETTNYISETPVASVKDYYNLNNGYSATARAIKDNPVTLKDWTQQLARGQKTNRTPLHVYAPATENGMAAVTNGAHQLVTKYGRHPDTPVVHSDYDTAPHQRVTHVATLGSLAARSSLATGRPYTPEPVANTPAPAPPSPAPPTVPSLQAPSAPQKRGFFGRLFNRKSLVFGKAFNPGGAFQRHWDADEGEAVAARQETARYNTIVDTELKRRAAAPPPDPKLQHEQFIVHGPSGTLAGSPNTHQTHMDLHGERRTLGGKTYPHREWSHWSSRDPVDNTYHHESPVGYLDRLENGELENVVTPPVADLLANQPERERWRQRLARGNRDAQTPLHVYAPNRTMEPIVNGAHALVNQHGRHPDTPVLHADYDLADFTPNHIPPMTLSTLGSLAVRSPLATGLPYESPQIAGEPVPAFSTGNLPKQQDTLNRVLGILRGKMGTPGQQLTPTPPPPAEPSTAQRRDNESIARLAAERQAGKKPIPWGSQWTTRDDQRPATSTSQRGRNQAALSQAFRRILPTQTKSLTLGKAVTPGGPFHQHLDRDEQEHLPWRKFSAEYDAAQRTKARPPTDPKLQHEQFIVHQGDGTVRGNTGTLTTHLDFDHGLDPQRWTHWSARDPKSNLLPTESPTGWLQQIAGGRARTAQVTQPLYDLLHDHRRFADWEDALVAGAKHDRTPLHVYNYNSRKNSEYIADSAHHLITQHGRHPDTEVLHEEYDYPTPTNTLSTLGSLAARSSLSTGKRYKPLPPPPPGYLKRYDDPHPTGATNVKFPLPRNVLDALGKALNPGGAFDQHLADDHFQDGHDTREQARLDAWGRQYDIDQAQRNQAPDPRLQYEQFMVHTDTGELLGSTDLKGMHQDLHDEREDREAKQGRYTTEYDRWAHFNARDPHQHRFAEESPLLTLLSERPDLYTPELSRSWTQSLRAGAKHDQTPLYVYHNIHFQLPPVHDACHHLLTKYGRHPDTPVVYGDPDDNEVKLSSLGELAAQSQYAPGNRQPAPSWSYPPPSLDRQPVPGKATGLIFSGRNPVAYRREGD